MTPEGVVKQRVKDLLKRYNILNAKDAHLATSDHDGWYHMPGQGGYGVVGGIPDFLGHYGGRLFGAECKKPGGKPTALQERQLHAIRLTGGAAFVVDGDDSLGVFENWLGEVRDADKEIP